MIIDTGNILLIGAVLLFFSIIAGKAGFRFGVPVLLLFLGVGMLFGSDGLGIQFNNPHGAQFIGMIALSIILFSGVSIPPENKMILRAIIPMNCAP